MRRGSLTALETCAASGCDGASGARVTFNGNTFWGVIRVKYSTVARDSVGLGAGVVGAVGSGAAIAGGAIGGAIGYEGEAGG